MIQVGTESLSASSDHTQAVVLNELHFPIEALGNAIVFSEPPHGRNLAPPTVKGFWQRLHRPPVPTPSLEKPLKEG